MYLPPTQPSMYIVLYDTGIYKLNIFENRKEEPLLIAVIFSPIKI